MNWFPGGTRLLVSGPAGAADHAGIWVLPIAGGSLEHVRDDAWGAVVSPDGARIAFMNQARNEVWLMRTDGGDARRLATSGTGYKLTELIWFPDGTRLTWSKQQFEGREARIESYHFATGVISTVWADPRQRVFCWAPDGALIVALAEPPPEDASSNFWEIPVNSRTVRASGPPRRLTNWPGFHPSYLSVSLDNKRLLFIRRSDQSDVMLSEWDDKGIRLGTPRRFTIDDRMDWPSGWTRDRRGLFFYSDRQGSFDIFRQSLEDRNPTAITSNPAEERSPQLSPDGSWILYLAWEVQTGAAPPTEARLMRIPLSGGPGTVVLTARGYPGPARAAADPRTVLTASGFPDFRCARHPSTFCVLGEAQDNRIAFSSFDPLRGRLEELAAVEVDPAAMPFWDLSPDGSLIAFSFREENRAEIRILALAGGPERKVRLSNVKNLQSVAWTADGGALFVTNWASTGYSLWHVKLTGEKRLLRKAGIWLEKPVPSPDGRYLAIAEGTSSSNVWMLEKFR